MKKLSDWLQNNPIIVVLMFFVSVISSVIGISLGWKQFYTDYLSKSVDVPVWLIIFGLIFVPIVYSILRRGDGITAEKELLKVEGKQFGVQQVVLDGKSFDRCEFHGTEIVFEGSLGCSLVRCNFDNPRFTFSRYAANTLSMLTLLYKDPAFKSLIEHTFDNIRAGAHPASMQPSKV